MTKRTRHLGISKLLVVFLLVGLFVFGFLHNKAVAITESGTINVGAIVPGPPPSTPSEISSPTPDQTFTSNPIVVTGNCPTEGLVIKIIDNGSFVGSTICKNTNTFSLTIDLFKGSNSLVVQEFDFLNQQGPDSQPVTVFYNPPTNPVTTSTTNSQSPFSKQTIPAPQTVSQLGIQLDPGFSGYNGYKPYQQISLPLRVSGGTAPYAVHINWGDDTDSLASLQSADQPLITTHTYIKAGNFQVLVTASDSSGQKATLSIVIIIEGVPAPLISGSTTSNPPSSAWHLMLFYQFFALLILLIGFGLGRLGHRTIRNHRRITPKFS
ncbi:MAG TPA: PKD domain-containing protein [Patescibacteria group bacterium]|nr:PKD domain-containing protein [Patescibacteria group bacterium]